MINTIGTSGMSAFFTVLAFVSDVTLSFILAESAGSAIGGSGVPLFSSNGTGDSEIQNHFIILASTSILFIHNYEFCVYNSVFIKMDAINEI